MGVNRSGPGPLRGGYRVTKVKEGASLTAAASAGRRNPGNDCLPPPSPPLIVETISFPSLLFSDDSFMPAFHFNDSIAGKLSHIKA